MPGNENNVPDATPTCWNQFVDRAAVPDRQGDPLALRRQETDERTCYARMQLWFQLFWRMRVRLLKAALSVGKAVTYQHDDNGVSVSV